MGKNQYELLKNTLEYQYNSFEKYECAWLWHDDSLLNAFLQRKRKHLLLMLSPLAIHTYQLIYVRENTLIFRSTFKEFSTDISGNAVTSGKLVFSQSGKGNIRQNGKKPHTYFPFLSDYSHQGEYDYCSRGRCTSNHQEVYCYHEHCFEIGGLHVVKQKIISSYDRWIPFLFYYYYPENLWWERPLLPIPQSCNILSYFWGFQNPP